MDHKSADVDHWPLLPKHDEERCLPEPAPPKRSRRVIAFTAKGLLILGVSLYLFSGFAQSIVERSFSEPPQHPHDAPLASGFQFLPYPHEFDDPRVICETINITDSASLLKSLSYNLTTSADKIKVFARGPIAGNVTFEHGGTAGDDIEVDLSFSKPDEVESIDKSFGNPLAPRRVHHPAPFKLKVCPFYAPGGGYNAIGIFVTHDCGHKHPSRGEPHGPPHGPPPPPPRRPHPPPGHPPPGPAVEASIAIRFPKPSSLDRLAIQDFSTELAGFNHSIPTLDIAFTKLTIVGTVTAAGIGATELAVVSVSGGITGNFSSSSKLLLTSSSGPIEANVELWNAESEEGLIEPSRMTAIADKSYIRANVSLFSYSSQNSKLAYEVKTVASNDYATVNITSQPVGSILNVNTFSNEHQTALYLHPAFEGRYDLNSIFSDPIIVVPEDTKDPYGEGRKRVVEADKTWTPWTKRGSVEWVKEAGKKREGEPTDLPPLGRVKMTTIKAQAAMILG